jgi:hypothetical protein
MGREGENRKERKKEGSKRAVVETDRSKRTQGTEQNKGRLVRREEYSKDA